MSRSSTVTEQLAYPTPGGILLEELLKPMELSQTALAREVDVSTRRVNEIVLGKRAVTADTDLRKHDLMAQRRQIGDKLKAIKPRAA